MDAILGSNITVPFLREDGKLPFEREALKFKISHIS